MENIKKITNNIYCIATPLLDNCLVNSYLIDGGDCWILVDSGLKSTNDSVIDAVLKFGPEKNIRYIVNTHSHYDCIGANAEIAEYYGSFIIAHKTAKEKIENHEQNFKNCYLNYDDFLKPEKETEEFFFSNIGARCFVDIVFSGSMDIRTENLELFLFESKGHTEDCISIYLKENSVIISGDSICERGTENLLAQYDNINTYLQTISSIQRLKPGLLLSSHFPPRIGKLARQVLKISKDETKKIGKAVEEIMLKNEKPTGISDITRDVCTNIGKDFEIQSMNTIQTHLRKLESRNIITGSGNIWTSVNNSNI